MITQFLFEGREEGRKTPRVRPKQSRLSQDTIARIISFVPSGNILTGSSRSCITARILGIPFIAIFYPNLLRPHYNEGYNTNWTLADIAAQEINWAILDENELIQAMHFDIRISIYAPSVTGTGRDQKMLYSLLRFPKRWKALRLQIKWTSLLSPLLRLFMPCLQYLDYLEALESEDFFHSSDLLPPFSASDRCHQGKFSENAQCSLHSAARLVPRRRLRFCHRAHYPRYVRLSFPKGRIPVGEYVG